MRVLIVEDEQLLRDQLADALRKAGYAVDQAAAGEDGLFMGLEYPIDLAILDLGLPDIDGLELLRRWREQKRSFPVLILTARSRWEEKVAGLETGADDYLVKPFHIEEVLARCRALTRRASGWSESTLTAGPLELNTTTQKLFRNGAEIELTAFEYRLLEYLILHAGEVISKTELAEHLYDEEADRDSNVLEVLIGRLRRKVDPEKTLNPIETLRGRGYRFTLARAES